MGLKEFFGFRTKKVVKKINEKLENEQVLNELEMEANKTSSIPVKHATKTKKHKKVYRLIRTDDKIFCKETGDVFNRVADIAVKYNLKPNSIYHALKYNKSLHGYTFYLNTMPSDESNSSKEVWKSAVGYEGIFEVSNTCKLRRLFKGETNELKIMVKKNGKSYASTTINNKYKTICVTDLMKKTFEQEDNSSNEIKMDLEVISVKATVSEEIESILNNWDSISSKDLKERLSLILVMNKEQENKMTDILTTIKETVDNAMNSIMPSMTNMDSTEEMVKESTSNDTDKEFWRTTYLSDNYQVSSLGRYRRKLSFKEAQRKGEKYIYSDGIFQGGRKMFSFQINGKQKVVNAAKVMLNSFNRTKFNKRVVFLNGDVTDVRLSNIAWKN